MGLVQAGLAMAPSAHTPKYQFTPSELASCPWGQAGILPQHSLQNESSKKVVQSDVTHDPKIQATRNTSYLTASKSLNGRKIARMAPILTIFGPNRSQRRNLFFEKFSNKRRRHRGIVVVVIVAVVVAVVAVVGRFWVACIKGTSL